MNEMRRKGGSRM